MAQSDDQQLELNLPSTGEIMLPELDVLGWTPAEHVAVFLDLQNDGIALYLPESATEEYNSGIEFTVSSLPAESLLVDLNAVSDYEFNLGGLLGGEDEVVSHLYVPAYAETGHDFESEDFFDMDSILGINIPAAPADPLDTVYPRLTIVIDDDLDPGSVAL